jgi:hypothetical protein
MDEGIKSPVSISCLAFEKATLSTKCSHKMEALYHLRVLNDSTEESSPSDLHWICNRGRN